MLLQVKKLQVNVGTVSNQCCYVIWSSRYPWEFVWCHHGDSNCDITVTSSLWHHGSGAWQNALFWTTARNINSWADTGMLLMVFTQTRLNRGKPAIRKISQDRYGLYHMLDFYGHRRACLNNPIFFNLGLCAACWAHFMCHHKLWPKSASHTFSFLNNSLGLAGGKYHQKITYPYL